eukprot:5845328-Amphidinium_carterae.2
MFVIPATYYNTQLSEPKPSVVSGSRSFNNSILRRAPTCLPRGRSAATFTPITAAPYCFDL